LIPSQTISLGRVTFGPDVSYVFKGNGMEVEPHIGIQGIWDFDKAEIVDPTSGLAAGSSSDVRDDDLDMYGGSVKVTVPLN